ncbi:hypothetical protein ACFQL4_15195 [Halosimplex aquaticum]
MTAERRDATRTTGGSADEPATAVETDATAPSDVFSALGGETRLDVVRALDDDSPRSFSSCSARRTRTPPPGSPTTSASSPAGSSDSAATSATS